jgi:hypothetical protein
MTIKLKKVWSWLKAYWYIPVIIIAIFVLTIIFYQPPASLMSLVERRRKLHEKEVESINNIHAEEIKKREEALLAYQKTIKAIEEKYNKDKADLTERKKSQIKKIVEETHNDPDLLAKKLADQMGFEIVYPKE